PSDRLKSSRPCCKQLEPVAQTCSARVTFHQTTTPSRRPAKPSAMASEYPNMILHSSPRSRNGLTEATLIEAIANSIKLDQAGQLSEAEAEILLVRQEEYEARKKRTYRQLCEPEWIAWQASKILKVSPERCEEAANAILWPNDSQLAAKVLRAWAADLPR